jgi:putative tricarboxylic transport membrane protein
MSAMAALAAKSRTRRRSPPGEPTKPVEIVVAAGAGGASAQMARMMQAAIQKNNQMKQPMVALKGGASGADSLMDMLPPSAKIPFNWRELTPVAVIVLDQFVLWDYAAGPKTSTSPVRRPAIFRFICWSSWPEQASMASSRLS